MNWLRTFGKFLISVGVGVLLFVAWIFWGTGIYFHREQRRLEQEFAMMPEITREPIKKGSNGREGGGPGDDYRPGAGDPVFNLRIPAIDVSDVVVEGVGVEELKLAPGHYPECRSGFSEPLCTEEEAVWPGERGRVILSGHRTTYGQPFYNLDRLNQGDDIITETKWGTFTYEVTDIQIVEPDAKNVAVPDPPGAKAEIALTTCNPKYSAAERLVVYAEMEEA